MAALRIVAFLILIAAVGWFYYENIMPYATRQGGGAQVEQPQDEKPDTQFADIDVAGMTLELLDSGNMSVSQAYQIIPHRQTTYNAATSRMSEDASTYFTIFFTLTDIATRARVEAMQQLMTGRGGMTREKLNATIDQVIALLDIMDVPAAAVEAHEEVTTAIAEQQVFLNRWYDMPPTLERRRVVETLARHTEIKSSHNRLIKSYGILMKSFPGESQHNKIAFYDHLCALDFI